MPVSLYPSLNWTKRDSLLIVLSLMLSIDIEKSEFYELNFYCSKTAPKAHTQNICAKLKSFNSKGTDTFAYNSDTSNFQEPILLHGALDGTFTTVYEEWHFYINRRTILIQSYQIIQCPNHFWGWEKKLFLLVQLKKTCFCFFYSQ